jgi:tRNA 2-thiouridine synthesizing protein A
MSHHELDARRLLCPLPVIRTQNRVAGLAPGDTLAVTCTDHGAANDIPAWCRINGHELVSIDDRGDELVITVRVGHDAEG